MFGGGSAQGMNDSLRNNRNLLRPKKPTRHKSYFHLDRNFSYDITASSPELPLTKAQRKNIIATLEKSKKRTRKISLALGILVFLVLGFSSYYFIVTEIAANKIVPQKEGVVLAIQKEYDFYISDGDQWLMAGDWHNAAFQYEKASHLLPEVIEPYLKLYTVYHNACKNEPVFCEKRIVLHNKILQKFPNHEAVATILLQ